MRFLRALTGRVLPCGCLLGVYETYEGQVVRTIDACGDACDVPAHRLHEIIAEPAAPAQPAPPAAPASAPAELSARTPDRQDPPRS